ncbi:transcription termination factor 1-like [Synchiropus splendidus]|uniref:transcription termination factor 1-like n=1 Tax=Synchiropus splendidus TaxID=270530 RepID=UPI00237DF3D4|nr:transcription termination factor 1-like [Synchiropus splendidus]
MTKKTPTEPREEEVSSPQDGSLANPKTKKRKRKSKDQEVAGEEIRCSSPVDSKKRKKKKKKKRKRDVEEEEGGAECGNDADKVIRAEVHTRHEEEDKERAENEDVAEGGSALASSELQELKEFFPDVEQRSAGYIRKLLHYDLPRFRRFKEEGVSIRKGRFTEEENLQIQQNVADFLALTGISSPGLLLFPHGDEEAHIRQLRAQHHFMERISEGIPRASQQVCLRARKLFDPQNKLGRFSEEELHSLVKLQHLHGNNWSMISSKMDRSAFALEKRFSLISSGRGPWTTEEESKLLQAIKSHLAVLVQKDPVHSGLTREQMCNNLPWRKISQQVGSRSWNQCRLKWLGLVRNKLAHGRRVFNRGPEGLQSKIKLIETLYNMQVDDMADINWDEVVRIMGHVTPVCVQKMFMRLKLTKVPHWMSLSYGEIIDILWENEIPRLQRMLKDRQSDLQGPHEGETYRLSDIISLEDREFMELDNTS